MKNKILSAAFAASLFFGGMHSASLASTSGSCTNTGGSVYCSSFAPGETVEDMLIVADKPNIFSVFTANYADIAATLQSIYDTNGTKSWFNGSLWGAGSFFFDETRPTVAADNVGWASVYSNISLTAKFIDGIAYVSGYLSTQSNLDWISAKGIHHNESASTTERYELVGSYNAVTPVPGPEAGVGLGALAILGVAYWAKRRRDEKAIAS